ncbi:MAG: glycerophosphodiester phosphodiesterase family protein, partial [Haliangium ochraceum]
AQPATRRPFLFAHRGGGGILPEETLPTLLAAEARDAAAIVEFDVHRSRDGHLVVIHDASVNRTTNGQGRVADLTLGELQALDAGYCASPGKGDGTASAADCQAPADPTLPALFPFRGAGLRIATLDEVLAALSRQTFISIEVKAPGFERQFADTMRASGRLDHLVTGSEDDDVAVRLEDLLPEAAHYLPRAAATCLALTAKLALDYQGCPQFDVFASPLAGAGLALDTGGVLRAAHRRGMVVIYWTINDEPTMERLFRLGADGIFTDYPDRGRQVVERLRVAGELP